MIGVIIEILKWIGTIFLVLLSLGVLLAVGLFIVVIGSIIIGDESDEEIVPLSICMLDEQECSAPEGTPCSCCGKYQYFEEQGKLS